MADPNYPYSSNRQQYANQQQYTPRDRFSRHLNLEDGKLIETVDGEQHNKTMRVYADGSVALGCTKISAAAMKHIVAKYTPSAS